jgi:hypothetical protein
MNWRLRRQLFILALLAAAGLIVAALIIVPKVTKPGTCFDSKQNGTEEGADCGGSCAMQCTDLQTPPTIVWARSVPVTTTLYTAVASVTNQNRTSALYKATYEFRLYDEANKFIVKREGSITLPPNRETTIVEPIIDVGTRPPKYTVFAWTTPLVWYRVDPRAIDVDLVPLDIVLTNEGIAPKLTANIKNTSLYDLPRTDVIALLYDKDNTLVGASKTYLENIASNETEPVFFTWPHTFPAPVAFTIVRPLVDIFSVPLQ